MHTQLVRFPLLYDRYVDIRMVLSGYFGQHNGPGSSPMDGPHTSFITFIHPDPNHILLNHDSRSLPQRYVKIHIFK